MIISPRRIAGAACCLAIAAASAAAQPPGRPAITGISHMCVYASDCAATEHFYSHVLGAKKGPDPQDAKGTRYYFSPTQFVEVLPLPTDLTISRMACVAYNTADADAMRRYLTAHDVAGTTELRTGSDGTRWFATKDPEGNDIQFIQPGQAPAIAVDAKPIGIRVIHVGYLVHSKAAEDRFYKDILGFRHTGLALCVRDIWTGYRNKCRMDTTGWSTCSLATARMSPCSMSISASWGSSITFPIGVPNMEQAVTTLISEDRLSPRHDGPAMGKDGKWQANLYDPDGTRIELMEFQPVAKPCCSDFTADSPVN